jgi:hypothetical protein
MYGLGHLAIEFLWRFLVEWVPGPILGLILRIFGYDEDWEPTREAAKRRSPVFSALFCFAVSGLCLGGLIWLVWFLLR